MHTVEAVGLLILTLAVFVGIAAFGLTALIVLCSDRFPPHPPATPQTDAESVSRPLGPVEQWGYTLAELDEVRRFFPYWPNSD